MLVSKPIGTYLTRWSPPRAQYCISVKTKKSDVRNYIVSENDQNEFAIGVVEKWFKTKDDLLEYHINTGILLYPLLRPNSERENIEQPGSKKHIQKVTLVRHHCILVRCVSSRQHYTIMLDLPVQDIFFKVNPMIFKFGALALLN